MPSDLTALYFENSVDPYERRLPMEDKSRATSTALNSVALPLSSTLLRTQ